MRCPLPAATPGKCHHHRKRDQFNHWGAEQQYSSQTADTFQNASTVWWGGLQWTSTPVQIQCMNSKKLRVWLACKVKVCSTLQGGCMNKAPLSQYHFLFYGFSSIFPYWSVNIMATRRNTFYLIPASAKRYVFAYKITWSPSTKKVWRAAESITFYIKTWSAITDSGGA